MSFSSSKKSNAVIEALFQDAAEALTIIDADGMIHAWNNEAQTTFGWTREDAVGRSLAALIELSEKWMADIAEQKRRDPAINLFPLAARHRDGHKLLLELGLRSFELDGNRYFGISLQAQAKPLTGRSTPRRRAIRPIPEDDINERLMEHALDVICAIDDHGMFIRVSKASRRLWGYSPEELIGRRFLDFIHLADRKPSLQEGEAVRRIGQSSGFENRFIHRNGQIVPMMWTLNWSAADRTLYGVARGMAQIKLAQRAFTEHHQRLNSLFEHHPDGVFAFDLEGRLLSANRAFATLTGYDLEELGSMSFRVLVAPESIASAEMHFVEATQGNAANFEAAGLRKDGSRYEAFVTVVPIIVDGSITGVHGIARDITSHRDAQRRIEYLATHDPLTGLPNRYLLNDRITHAINQAERQGYLVGVLFLDLNRFKMINDSLGHHQGDALLRIIADRLRLRVRQADTVARIGGDEFVVVLEDVASPEDVIAFAGELLTVIEKPVSLAEHEFSVSSSIGCSFYPRDGLQASALIRNADLAMYEAKSAGGGALRLYKPDMEERVKARLTQEHQLRQAMARHELVVYYQPRISIASNLIVGVEALIRWQHPSRGLVPPNEFIPLAEEIGLISELGEWVLHTACCQSRQWQEAGLAPLKLSVNLSPYQLVPESSIAEAVRTSLSQSGLDPQWLELEITESGLMQNVESTLEKLTEIRVAGVSISIDDFGTGYSSLSHLQRLPVDTLKIDQSFIRDISNSRDDAAIVAATIALAHTMQLKVVAEGVTTDAQISFLREHECDEVQGFLYSPAVPAEELVRLLRGNAFTPASSMQH